MTFKANFSLLVINETLYYKYGFLTYSWDLIPTNYICICMGPWWEIGQLGGIQQATVYVWETFAMDFINASTTFGICTLTILSLLSISHPRTNPHFWSRSPSPNLPSASPDQDSNSNTPLHHHVSKDNSPPLPKLYSLILLNMVNISIFITHCLHHSHVCYHDSKHHVICL